MEPPKTPEEGYHFMEDMTDRRSPGCASRGACCRDKPFFMYFAPGRRTRRITCPRSGSRNIKGKFDQGWDKLREETFARQKSSGVIPPMPTSPPRPAEIPAWDEMPAAAAGDGAPDGSLRRLPRVRRPSRRAAPRRARRIEALDDTLIYYIIGDNGASAEGTPHGTFNEMMPSTVWRLETRSSCRQASTSSAARSPTVTTRSVGRTRMDTPYQWTKQVASHWGGTRNGTIVRWPKGIKAKGEVRHQFHHVIDVAPTVLEAAGIARADDRQRRAAEPMQGVSMRYSFDDAKARRAPRDAVLRDVRQPRHLPQGLDGGHPAPHAVDHDRQVTAAFDDDVWELYDTHEDWSQAHDLSKEMPDKLHELQRLWIIEAVKYNVLPARRPHGGTAQSRDRRAAQSWSAGNTQVLANGMGRPQRERRDQHQEQEPFRYGARSSCPRRGAEGVILAQGGIVSAAGCSTSRTASGRISTTCSGLQSSRPRDRAASGRQDTRSHGVRLRRRRPGQGRHRDPLHRRETRRQRPRRPDGAVGVLGRRDSRRSAGKRVRRLLPDMPAAKSAFNGTVNVVVVQASEENTDHLLDREQVLAMIMARQ